MKKLASRQTAPPAVHEALLASPGRPLEPQTRGLMASRFAHDFSNVRVHTDARAAEAADAVAANAFTVGRDVFFAENLYAPQTEAGQKLLAHELTHVVQQAHSPDARVQGDFWTFFGSEGSFDKDELLAYLNVLRTTHDIENDEDSDNKARVVVRVWKTGDRDIELNPELKKLLVREMWKGYTSDVDQEGILDILERSASSELRVIFGAGGVTPAELLDSFGGDYEARLQKFYSTRFEKDPTKGKIEPSDVAPAVVTQLNDETFRQRWENALRVGLKKLELGASPNKPEEQIRCAFPGTLDIDMDRTGPRFDEKKWDLTIAQGYVPKRGTPYDAVTDLFDNLNKWSCDCALYAEIAWLYAWWLTLDKNLFNQKFRGLHLQTHDTSGLEREKIPTKPEESEPIEGYEGGPSKTLDRAAWADLPYGTRVVWKNLGCIGDPSWERENAIKVTRKGERPAKYDAHGVGYGVTESQVLEAMSEGCTVVRYQLTKKVLRDVKAEFGGNPLLEKFIESLGPMADLGSPDSEEAFTDDVHRAAGSTWNALSEEAPVLAITVMDALLEKARLARKDNIIRLEAQIPR